MSEESQRDESDWDNSPKDSKHLVVQYDKTLAQ